MLLIRLEADQKLYQNGAVNLKSCKEILLKSKYRKREKIEKRRKKTSMTCKTNKLLYNWDLKWRAETKWSRNVSKNSSNLIKAKIH